MPAVILASSTLDTTDLRKDEIGSSVASMRQFEAIGQCNFMGIQNGNKKGVKCVTSHVWRDASCGLAYTVQLYSEYYNVGLITLPGSPE